MQQASNIAAPVTIRRAAQVVVVILALAGLLFASCMLVTAGETLALLQPSDQGAGLPDPGPTAPPPPAL